MSKFILFDTSVLVDHLRTNCHHTKMQQLNGIVRYSSVVLAELLRGATNNRERQFIEKLAGIDLLLTPTTRNWMDSGSILSQWKRDFGLQTNKLRDLHFDVLIALTARSHGTRLITSNRTDFECIRKYVDFKLEIW